MNDLSCFVKEVENQLSRELHQREMDFLVWLYEQHEEECKVNCN
ncbi:hypothetical protein [Aquibacillus rhizosphaerae]|uniref:Uncharacterized protein n=1 Tax=Aquibacillus rhizosphaerae TaxID=3051431 RepID=A0ABT7L780_9BACI|nr:hypothetical protein [Aquibacillus sp. LR5S19]MDL4841710.1 hypothetical protein [Aquibacillus sp. LR5S19]